MSKVKHTPGPWQVCAGFIKTYYPSDALIVNAGTRTSDVAWVPCRYEDLPEMDVTQRANAALIAAAPDLLDACIAALEVIDELIGADYDITGEQAKCKAAIAKAKGLQP